MKPIIEVNNLSKKFRYGETQSYYTLRDILMDVVSKPFKFINHKPQTSIINKGEFWALKDISFKVNQGEAVGIIGPNGSGKSTLLKILSQITPPTFGEATLRGRVGSLLEVGTGFQQELTGRENVYLNGAILGMTRREISKKFDEIVDFSGVEKFLDTPVKHYSSGMYMRLAFAVAAHLDSEILLVDEVLAVGDVEFQKKCLGKMDNITNKEGRTILFVSHNLEAVKKLCSKCILLGSGMKIFEGGVDNALTKYKDLQHNLTFETKNGVKRQNHKGSGTLSFVKIDIFDSENKKRNIFKINETARIKVSYVTYEKMDGLYLIVYVYSTKIKDFWLTDFKYEIKSGMVKKGATGEVNIELELSGLRPGEYPLGFWLGDKDSTLLGVKVNYAIVENMTKSLIIEARNDLEMQMSGIISLRSKLC